MEVSNIIVLAIIIVNTLISVATLLLFLFNKRGPLSYIYFAIMLVCPILGPCYFLFAYVLFRINTRNKELTYGDISFDASRHERKQKADLVEEVDILPLEEAFIVSDKGDRRKALLTTLKRDYNKNISSILMGLNNEDTETSHYAASVVLSTSTEYLNLLAALKMVYEAQANEDNSDPAHAYLQVLRDYMDSDILDATDKKKYISIHSNVMAWLYKTFREELYMEDYIYELNLLLEIEDYEEAIVWSNRLIHTYSDNDAAFYYTMKLYYLSGQFDKFLEMLTIVMKSDMSISNETLQIIRFLNYRPNQVF